MKVVYIVSVKYVKFEFHDMEEAMVFAENAKWHFKPCREDDNCDVSVKIVKIEEEF